MRSRLGNAHFPPLSSEHRVHLQRRYFDLIAQGRKTAEARVEEASRQLLSEGDLIRFACDDEEVLARMLVIWGSFVSAHFGIPKSEQQRPRRLSPQPCADRVACRGRSRSATDKRRRGQWWCLGSGACFGPLLKMILLPGASSAPNSPLVARSSGIQGFRKQRTVLGAGFGRHAENRPRWPCLLSPGEAARDHPHWGHPYRPEQLHHSTTGGLGSLHPTAAARGPVSAVPGPLPSLVAAVPSLGMTGRDTRPGARRPGGAPSFAAAFPMARMTGRETRPDPRRTGEGPGRRPKQLPLGFGGRRQPPCGGK